MNNIQRYRIRCYENGWDGSTLEDDGEWVKWEDYEKVANNCIKEFYEIEQRLGKALDYPWYKDDQKNFPGATEKDGVCVGVHVPVTIAMEAAHRIEQLEDALYWLRDAALYRQYALDINIGKATDLLARNNDYKDRL